MKEGINMSRPIEEICEFAIVSTLAGRKPGLYECVSLEYCEYKVNSGVPYLCSKHSYKDSGKFQESIDKMIKLAEEALRTFNSSRPIKSEEKKRPDRGEIIG